jgi:putative ABC transport system substrate-binding protein
MKRRDFVAGLVLAGAAGSAWAQAPAKPHRIALVHSSVPADQLTEAGGKGSLHWIGQFLAELRRLGHAEGHNLIVERYSLEGRTDRLAGLAGAVVDRNPEVIVTVHPLVSAFRAATGSIPIVAILADPLSFGLVTSLARPGGNLTGVTIDAGIEIYAKQLQILKEVVPLASNVAYVAMRAPWMGAIGQAVRDAGPRLGMLVSGVVLTDATPSQFRGAFADLARQRPDAIMVGPAGQFLASIQLIIQLVEKSRLPAIYPYREYVELGGLMAYAPDLADPARHLANQVHQILNGANPSDIPIYQPTKFELILNLNTTNALGLTVPPSILARADEVIE